MLRTPAFLTITCAVLGFVACDDERTPAMMKPAPQEPGPSAAAADPTPQPKAELAPNIAPNASQPVPEPNHACASGTDLALGNAYASLACLPQLDEISYWQVANEWAKYDAAPVTVAVLDLSFLVDHPDIAKAVDFTWNFLTDGCGTVDATKGDCKAVTPPAQNPATPAFGDAAIELIHGTMLAGLVAGRGEPGKGIVGVNPSAKLDLIVRDMNTDNLTSLRYAVDHKVDVISMSWPLGTLNGEKDVPEFETLLETAAKQGTVVVMAAGNSKLDVDAKPVYPTRYSTIPGVIAVGSVDLKGDFYAQFSNYGPEYVELGAPGTAASSGGDFQNGHYSVQIGSSYSAPIVAGAASRVIQYLKSKNVPYTAAQVEQLLLDGSLVNPKLTPYFKDGKMLNMGTLYEHVTAKYP